ncbi:ABC transporter ATP-binding protein [Ureibacillus sp. FSL K6-8385]|uniref:Carnitine transport ATP-binding protein OpuCA n=1 Tax=Ureibacillus terrenus TaxID=118246 RepID=A0A540V4N9_9BACL|nr:ABC transporter ATP-binding protein [Ureibacillus terrenus]MED3662806.1 ABC transporter ATP-binding protein [Ureibacillus terrenus]MED3763722.1 ABC transporter ATP-binding protein [Ureibacillus terrenus]TQE91153.1 ABC transporter ATP-binding protein [Ureibacillus terrenus]
MDEHILLENVNKSFPKNNRSETVTLEDVSLSIKRGEFISLLGPSGCGKSTLLNIIAGLEKETSGKVLVNGNPITGPGNDRIVVFQESGLFPWMTVLENVMYGLLIKKVPKEEAKERAMVWLQKVHLGKFADRSPHELSGGMKQRVAIARALVMDPEILLMDEPFAALDEQTRMVLHQELETLWRETGKTIIFVTHNIREALVLSDRVVLMKTRPGGIKNIFPVQAARPRNSSDSILNYLENRILSELEQEMEKVLKEELGSDYALKKDRVYIDPHNNLGSDI